MHRLFAREGKARIPRHLHGHPQGGPRAALADPHLEHPDLALLDRELDVAEVAVVALKHFRVAPELGARLGQALVKGAQGVRLVGAGHDVLALGVEHDVAVESLLAGGWVAGEEHSGARIPPPVAEDHGLDRDRGAEVVGDALVTPVSPGSITVPRFEYSLDGAPELLPGVVRRLGADDPTVHLVEPPQAVGGERLIPGQGGQPLRRGVVEPQVEDRVHHPRHRDGRPRAHAHQQGIAGVPQAPPGQLGKAVDVSLDLRIEIHRPAGGQKGLADRGGDREGGRDGKAELGGHDHQVGRLATQQLGEVRQWQGGGAIDVVDVVVDGVGRAADRPIAVVGVPPGGGRGHRAIFSRPARRRNAALEAQGSALSLAPRRIHVHHVIPSIGR